MEENGRATSACGIVSILMEERYGRKATWKEVFMGSNILRRISTGWLKSRLRLILAISSGMNKIFLLFHMA
jgi:hypothetical protein